MTPEAVGHAANPSGDGEGSYLHQGVSAREDKRLRGLARPTAEWRAACAAALTRKGATVKDVHESAETVGRERGDEVGPALLTPTEAAQYLNVTERWIRRAVAERRIDFVKVGKLLRFRREDLALFVVENRRPRSGS